jgi:tRNA nucleotidyltransferase (CCA-adding enzyme)
MLARLRFSNEERARITALIRHHLICYQDDWTDAAVRRWIRRITPELAPDLYDLGVADALGKGRDASADIASIQRLRARVDEVLAKGTAFSAKDLVLGGNELMSALGLAPGRVVGEILAHLVEVVTDDPDKNDRDRLLDEARRFLAERV